MLDVIDKKQFPESYDFSVTWQLGNELLLIGMGGETVVDYSLKFKGMEKNQPVCGYTNFMVSYIPSGESGKKEAMRGPHLMSTVIRLAMDGNVEQRITEL